MNSKCSSPLCVMAGGYSADSLSREYFHSMYQLWENEELCDVELVAGDQVYRAHRVVLAACSMYFRAMFCRQMAESGQRRITIEGVDAEALNLLIKFAYAGPLDINEDNAQSVLAAANFLQMIHARDVCCKFFETKLDASNCLEVAEFAEFHACHELLEAALHYAEQNFDEVAKSERFVSVSKARIQHFLSSNDLVLRKGEEAVFRALVVWTKHNPAERKQYFPELLENVKLPLLNEMFFAIEVAANPYVNGSEPCMALAREAAESLYRKGNSDGMAHLYQTPAQIPQKWWPREMLRKGEVIHIFGGVSEHETLGNVECYDPKEDVWVVDMIKPMSFRRSGVGVAVLHGLLFAIGGYLDGKRSTNAVECYNSRLNRWFPVTPMLTKRMNLGVGTIADLRDNQTGTSHSYIFSVGGYSGESILGSAERYDIRTNSWEDIAHMRTPRRNVGVAVIGSLLYAVGGSNRDDGTRSNLNSMERYHPDRDEWEDMPPMHRCRGAASVTALDGCLYAVGGYDSGQWLYEVERFDPHTNQWTVIAPMQFCRTGVAVTALKGEVYAIGGYNGSKTVDVVEKFNPESGSWKQVASLKHGRSVPGIAVACVWPVEYRSTVPFAAQEYNLYNQTQL